MSDDPLVAVRRDPHFARSLQFLLLFHPAFPNLLPDIHEIKPDAALIVRLEWLLAFETDPTRLSHPFCALLKPLCQVSQPFAKMNAESLLTIAKRLLEAMEWPVDFSQHATGVLELSVSERCRLLCDLCEMHLADPTQFQVLWQPHIKDGEAAWRLEPVGSDHAGRLYYVFDDGRLYRERSAKVQDWELLAASVREWSVFLEKGLTGKAKDKQLVLFLRNEIFPDTQLILEQVEHEERKLVKEMELSSAPRKRSNRLQAIKEADDQKRQEEEQRLKEESKRRRVDKEAESLLPIYTPPKGGKSREERMREREIKKLISLHTFADDHAASDGDHAASDDDQDHEQPISVGGSQSPLKLIFKRTADGYQSSLLTSEPDITLPSDPIVVTDEQDEHKNVEHNVVLGLAGNVQQPESQNTVIPEPVVSDHADLKAQHNEAVENERDKQIQEKHIGQEPETIDVMGIQNIISDTPTANDSHNYTNTNQERDYLSTPLTAPEDEAMHILASIDPDSQ